MRISAAYARACEEGAIANTREQRNTGIDDRIYVDEGGGACRIEGLVGERNRE